MEQRRGGGELIKRDSLYKNLYNYWTCYHASDSPLILFTWYHPKTAKLEKHIRRKWESIKDLPYVNTVLKKIKEKEEYFNPKRYLGGDEEIFMEIFQQWKKAHEK